jgi:hypothetical protein
MVWVFIDDTNANIQYSGPWFPVETQDDDNVTQAGVMGPPFQNTLHGVNVSASFSFSFDGMPSHGWVVFFNSSSFLGSSVAVFGTSNNGQGPTVTWECSVDDVSISGHGFNTTTIIENNWIFTSNGLVQDGHHVLTVNASVSNQQTFYVDLIQYIPSSNVSLDQSLLGIVPSDPAILYSPGWQQSKNDSANYTQTAGSTLTYNFYGT